MSYTVQVLPEATEETAAIYAYYEEASQGLGERFLQALNDCYQHLALYPVGQKRKGDFRHAQLDTFPIRVVYEVRDELVLVYQVRHTKRRPSQRFGP